MEPTTALFRINMRIKLGMKNLQKLMKYQLSGHMNIILKIYLYYTFWLVEAQFLTFNFVF